MLESRQAFRGHAFYVEYHSKECQIIRGAEFLEELWYYGLKLGPKFICSMYTDTKNLY